MIRDVGGRVTPGPGSVVRDRDGQVLGTWALDVVDGRIQTIRAVNNPDKLGHVGPVADAWEALRTATNRAQRPAASVIRGPGRDRRSRIGPAPQDASGIGDA
ncbi:hypothetical protein [Streptomyces sp. NPDC101237]|uniref:hypothetical protein n=1 Tax=Streptomyces sp. NPDC101237 TaxID=3366139 RepID=UPI003814ED15